MHDRQNCVVKQDTVYIQINNAYSQYNSEIIISIITRRPCKKMEALLNSQKIEVDELNRLIRNYKKDSNETRKTKRYLEDNLKTYSDAFATIENLHHDIMAIYIERKRSKKLKRYTTGQ